MAPGAFGSLVTIPMVFVSNGTGLMLKNRVPAPGSNPMVGTFVWSNGVQNGSSFTPIGNTTLYVTATDTNGCVSTDTINILIHPSDSSITVSGSLAFCSGNSVTLTAASGQSYLWSNGDTTQSITINQSGSYYALVTTANGCIDTSSTRTTTVYPVADTTVTVTGSLSFCSGSSVTLTAANGQSYLWNTGDTTQSITSNQSGSYYAVVTNADGCSDTTATYTTTLFADPINTVTASNTTLCVNDSALLSAYPGYAYLWNTNDTTQSIKVHTSGNYFVSLTSSDGCSAISDTVIISVVPDATEIFGNDLVQPNSAQVYATQQNPGNTYSWVVTGGALVSGQNTNAISVLWGAAGNGQISVQENSGLCTYSDTLEVTISGIGVGESVLPESLIYPNPNNGLFTLEVAEALVGSEYELTDGLGRLIEKGKIESTSQDFDLLRKPKGVYRLSIKSTNGIKTMAVVVQ